MVEKRYGLAVKAVILDGESRVLLLKRSGSSRFYVGKWELPGGKVDPGEDFAEALLREIAEETDLDVSINRLAGAVEWEMPAVRVVCVIMECSLLTGEVCLSDEHEGFAWMDRAQIPDMDVCEHFRSFLEVNYGERE